MIQQNNKFTRKDLAGELSIGTRTLQRILNEMGNIRYVRSGPAIDPIATKSRILCLSVGDVLTLKYDYGAGWDLSIELVSVTEMKKGTGTRIKGR